MKRREFIAFVGGAVAVVWPFTLRGQQPAQISRIGYLAPGSSAAGLLARDERSGRACKHSAMPKGVAS